MFCLIFLLFVIPVEGIHAIKISNQTSAQGQKKSPPVCPPAATAGHTPAIANNDAYGNDFDACMINRWTSAAAAGKRVLRTSPTASCNKNKHARLCYGMPARRPDNAQYISCYNTDRLIPEFTAHVVRYSAAPTVAPGRPRFSSDNGPCAPNPQSVAADCGHPPGATGNYFCSRGHLTPNAAFDTNPERGLTFKMTNVAPQWQEFNAGNWAAVERAVKDYVQTNRTDLYVFTGTAGVSKYWQWGWRWTFTAPTVRIVVPKYYWKAVCDPAAEESIFFIAENNVRETSHVQVVSPSCFNMRMTKERGVVQCESMSEAAGRCIRNWWHGVVVPDFDPVNCGTGRKGEFLKPYLRFR